MDAVKPYRIFGNDLKARRQELITTFRMSMAHEFESAGCLEGASAVWALWAGYLKKPAEQRYLDFLDRNDIPMEVHHSSGHAHLKDLQRMASAVSPRRLVPIHSFGTDLFKNHFGNVEMRTDGEWWEL